MLNPQSDLCGCAWGQKESIAIAIHRLGCTIYKRLAGLLYYTMLLELSLAYWYFVARFYDVIGWISCVTATYFPPFWGFVEVVRAVKEEGPVCQRFNHVGVTSFVAALGVKKESVPIAVNRLGCTIYEQLAGFLYLAMLLKLSFVCWHFVA